MKKQKVIAGVLAALIGITGTTGYLQEVKAVTFAYSDGEMQTCNLEEGIVETVEEDTNEVSRENVSISVEASEEMAEDSGIYTYAAEENELFQAVGIDWDEKKESFVYDGERLTAVWVEDGSFTSFDSETDDGICIYISKEKKDNQVILEAHEMSPEEFAEFYNENNTDGNKISVRKSQDS